MFNQGIELRGKKKHSYNLLRQVVKRRIGTLVMRDFNAIQTLKLKQPEQDNPVFEVSLLATGIRVDIFPEFCEEGCVSQQALTIKFQIKNKQMVTVAWGYNYLLDGRVLGAVNKE